METGYNKRTNFQPFLFTTKIVTNSFRVVVIQITINHRICIVKMLHCVTQQSESLI